MPTTKPNAFVRHVHFEGVIGDDGIRKDSEVKCSIYLDRNGARHTTQQIIPRRDKDIGKGETFIGALDVPAGIYARMIQSVDIYYLNESHPLGFDNWDLDSIKVFFEYDDGTRELVFNATDDGTGGRWVYRFSRKYPTWSVDVDK